MLSQRSNRPEIDYSHQNVARSRCTVVLDVVTQKLVRHRGETHCVLRRHVGLHEPLVDQTLFHVLFLENLKQGQSFVKGAYKTVSRRTEGERAKKDEREREAEEM